VSSTVATAVADSSSTDSQKLLDAITQQGVVVRDLKANKAVKTDIDAAVAKLLTLKVLSYLARNVVLFLVS
jgi:hypothetical protein